MLPIHPPLGLTKWYQSRHTRSKMASKVRHIKEPPILGTTCNNFSYWKMCMVNFLNLIDVWDIIEKGYSPKYNAGTKVLTTESKLEKTKNESAINVILNFINEQIAIDFEDSSNARDMWLALLNRYEGNTQIKRTKLNSLETQFEN